MKANELRIGNWFIDYEAEPETTIYWQVESIERASSGKGKLGVRYRSGSCWIIDEGMEPIPLTPEWLQRFGFYCDYSRLKDGTGCYKKGWVFIVLADRGFYAYAVNSGGHISRTMQYVHQLQNLYFALTGEELEIND